MAKSQLQSKERKRNKKNKKLTNMARKQLDNQGAHGGGKSDPTTPKPATPGSKIYQVG